MGNKILLDDNQIKALERIWFIYGNNGKKHTHCNHRYIQNLLEQQENTKAFYQSSQKNDLTNECIESVEKILNKTI